MWTVVLCVAAVLGMYCAFRLGVQAGVDFACKELQKAGVDPSPYAKKHGL